jgi:hypothetical protein
MKPLKPQQIAWWDETHRKCITGQRAGLTTYAFQVRTRKGKLDLEAGKYDDSWCAWVNVYEKEVRLCLGCGIYEKLMELCRSVCKAILLFREITVSLKDDRRNVCR